MNWEWRAAIAARQIVQFPRKIFSSSMILVSKTIHSDQREGVECSIFDILSTA